jgi:hypothetical protein
MEQSGNVTIRNQQKSPINIYVHQLIHFIFMFVPCINSIKALLLFHNDAHDHKITGILKQLKYSDGRSDMFRFT